MANHPIVHIEFPAHDPAAAAQFYASLFGWRIEVEPAMNYHLFQPDPGPGGGFVPTGDGGEISYRPGEILVYIATDDIDATLARAEALGGKTLVPRTEIPHTGWFGIFADPTGNRVGLFTGMSQQP